MGPLPTTRLQASSEYIEDNNIGLLFRERSPGLSLRLVLLLFFISIGNYFFQERSPSPFDSYSKEESQNLIYIATAGGLYVTHARNKQID